MLRVDQGDASIGVDAEDRREGVFAGPIIDPYVLPPPQHGLFSAPVEPDPSLEPAHGLLGRHGAADAREGEDGGHEGEA
jgi:hypothetical protein